MTRKLFILKAALVLVSLSLFIPLASGATPDYDERMTNAIFPVGSGWTPAQNLSSMFTIPKDCVVEIIGENWDAAVPYDLGARTAGSTIDRRLSVNEAESGRGSFTRFLVQLNNGEAQFYADGSPWHQYYYVVGFWEDVTFTEQWDSHQVTAMQDDMWYELQTGLGLQANSTHLITIGHIDVGREQIAGVRNTTSSLNRYLAIMEAEGGGNQTISMYVQADTNGYIDVYTEQYTDHYFINQGYFDSSIIFRENWVQHTPAGGGWINWDLTSYIEADEDVVDFMVTNTYEAGEIDIGIRKDGTSLDRKIPVREAEGGGYGGYGESCQTSFEGIIEMYYPTGTYARFFFSGYFEFAAPAANVASVNVQLSITDMDDTDNLYSEKKMYHLSYHGYDANGYENITYVKIYINQSATSRAIIIWNQSKALNQWSLISGNWEINIIGAEAIRSGPWANLSLPIYPSWDATEEADLELEAKITDTATTDHDILQTDYVDVITTLVTSSIECTDGDTPDRVNVGVNSQIDFSVRYADNPASGSASDDYPRDSNFTGISVYDSSDNNKGTDATIVNGDGSVSFNEATVQSETYNLFVDIDDFGGDFIDHELTDLTETIIWDRLLITFNVDDTTPEELTDATFTVDIVYDYDGANCTTYFYDIRRNGTIYQDDYQARSFTDNQAAPTKYVYDVIFLNETLYGLSVYNDDDNIVVQWFVAVGYGKVNLLFGVGFNHSTPYVVIRWNYSGNVDNYEVFHSTDNITYASLALTPNNNYNHTGLVNGTLHYYRVRSTFWAGEWQNSSLSPINLERVYFSRGAGNILNVTHVGGDFETYNVTLVVIVKGTNHSGTLESLAFNDTDSFFINETAGVAGFDVRYNFSSVDHRAKSLSLRVLCRYEGNPAHDVTIEAWDFGATDWVILEDKDEHNMEWSNYSLSYGDYIRGGKVWVRVYHATAGVGTHWLETDYVRLRAFIPQAQTGGLYWVALLSLIILVASLITGQRM